MNSKKHRQYWAKVRIGSPDQCWPWMGYVAIRGYGQIGETDRAAHRRAWSYCNGEIPAGLCVCHHCDNKICCNPSHLFLGTIAENNADRDRKGRCQRLKGEEKGGSKLTDNDVIDIRNRQGEGPRQLGREFGVSHVSIIKVLRHETWRHI